MPLVYLSAQLYLSVETGHFCYPDSLHCYSLQNHYHGDYRPLKSHSGQHNNSHMVHLLKKEITYWNNIPNTRVNFTYSLGGGREGNSRPMGLSLLLQKAGPATNQDSTCRRASQPPVQPSLPEDKVISATELHWAQHKTKTQVSFSFLLFFVVCFLSCLLSCSLCAALISSSFWQWIDCNTSFHLERTTLRFYYKHSRSKKGAFRRCKMCC